MINYTRITIKQSRQLTYSYPLTHDVQFKDGNIGARKFRIFGRGRCAAMGSRSPAIRSAGVSIHPIQVLLTVHIQIIHIPFSWVMRHWFCTLASTLLSSWNLYGNLTTLPSLSTTSKRSDVLPLVQILPLILENCGPCSSRSVRFITKVQVPVFPAV